MDVGMRWCWCWGDIDGGGLPGLVEFATNIIRDTINAFPVTL